jgi:hypothetical protein
MVRLVRVVAGIDLVFLAALAAALVAYGPGTLWFGVPWAMRLALALPWLAALGSIPLPYVVWAAWRQAGWTAAQRASATLGAAGAAGFLLFAGTYHLFGL